MRISKFLKQMSEGWCIIHDEMYKAGFHYFFSIADLHCPYNNPTEFENQIADELKNQEAVKHADSESV